MAGQMTMYGTHWQSHARNLIGSGAVPLTRAKSAQRQRSCWCQAIGLVECMSEKNGTRLNIAAPLGLTRVSPFPHCILIKLADRASCRLHYFPHFMDSPLLASDHHLSTARWISRTIYCHGGPWGSIGPLDPRVVCTETGESAFSISSSVAFPW